MTDEHDPTAPEEQQADTLTFDRVNKWLNEQPNLKVMRNTPIWFSDSLADIPNERFRGAVPKPCRQWSGRIIAALALYLFALVIGPFLQDFTNPAVLTLGAVGAVVLLLGGGWLAKKAGWVDDK